jgi:hypothetical protein
MLEAPIGGAALHLLLPRPSKNVLTTGAIAGDTGRKQPTLITPFPQASYRLQFPRGIFPQLKIVAMMKIVLKPPPGDITDMPVRGRCSQLALYLCHEMTHFE